jgi:acyl-coenzyme A thioesterase PaaI-like protein
MDGPSIQERMWPESLCWGCGPANHQGLQIRSHWQGEESVCRFTPLPAHAAGPVHVVNGGILATLLDCHSVSTAVAATYRREGREIGSSPRIWCVTGTLAIRYLKPTPIDAPIELRARVEETGRRATTVRCSVISRGVECARGEVIAVQVPFEERHAAPGVPGPSPVER